jgi:hypothetical protein
MSASSTTGRGNGIASQNTPKENFLNRKTTKVENQFNINIS